MPGAISMNERRPAGSQACTMSNAITSTTTATA
jgi:hypothetical protein